VPKAKNRRGDFRLRIRPVGAVQPLRQASAKCDKARPRDPRVARDGESNGRICRIARQVVVKLYMDLDSKCFWYLGGLLQRGFRPLSRCATPSAAPNPNPNRGFLVLV
jgi:hypothetical protein